MAKYYFARVEAKGAKYYRNVGILAILALGWLVASYIRFINGMYITGMSHSVTWAGAKVLFVLFVGLSAGSLMFSALAYIFGQKEYKVFGRLGAFLSVIIMLCGALLILISDWGRPDRIMLPFYMINPRSMLSLNSWIYMTYIVVGIAYLFAQIKGKETLAKVLGITAVITAIFVHSGTGFIFGVVNGRDLFFSSITPLAFVIAALSSGGSLVMLILYFTFKATGRTIDMRFFTKLSRVVLGLMIFVFYLVTIEHLTHLYAPEFQVGEKYIMFGGNFFTWVFWGELYGLGLIIPIILLLNPRTRGNIKWILTAGALHVFGVLGERMLFILPGQFLPIPIFPGYEITNSVFGDGEIVGYIPHIAEWTQFIGIFGLLGLVYIMGLRILPLLPVEGKYVKEEH